MIAALQSSARCVRHGTYQAIIGVGGETLPQMIRAALKSRDAVLRLWGMRDARNQLCLGELEQLLPNLLQDSFLPVRREALNCALAQFPGRAKQDLVEALLDKSYSLRDFARFHLKKSAASTLRSSIAEICPEPINCPMPLTGWGKLAVTKTVL